MSIIDEQPILKLKQILGDPKASPPIPPLIPVSMATWFREIKLGNYPKPIQLTERSVGWRSEDIKKLIADFKTQIQPSQFHTKTR